MMTVSSRRRFTVLAAGLLSSSLIAGAAVADSLSGSPLCKSLDRRLERCQSGARLSSDTRAFCDRVEAGFRALCGPLETIGASAAAEGGALDLLREDYLVLPIEEVGAGVFPSHLVTGPADLDDPEVIALLRRAYRVGKTVAVAGATEYEARRFHGLLRLGEQANCQPAQGQAEVELYGLQRSQGRAPPQNSSYCLVNLDQRSGAADRRWLRERFGPTPPQPTVGEVSPTNDDDPTEFLTDLATATHCSFKATNEGDLGDVEVDLYVYAMRDFTDTGCSSCENPGADYYLVQDNVTYSMSASGITFAIEAEPPIEAGSDLPLLPGLLGLEFADPATATTFESSYINGSSVTASGSIGFDADGPNVTGGGQVTTSEETTYSVPPTTILNESDPADAEPKWQFTPQSLQGGDFQVAPTWTWYVPQDAYPTGGTGSGQIFFNHIAGVADDFGGIGGEPGPQCHVPYPFSAWTVNPPELSSLEPASTEINGGQFTITGQDMYPGSVVAVLIGGTAVPLSTNVDLVDDTTIEVVVPGGFRPGNYEVQVNTQFNGENRFSNTLQLTLTD
jgi:hypothetical protein